MSTPNPDCWLCFGQGLMQSESYDGKPLVPCRCVEEKMKKPDLENYPAATRIMELEKRIVELEWWRALALRLLQYMKDAKDERGR